MRQSVGPGHAARVNRRERCNLGAKAVRRYQSIRSQWDYGALKEVNELSRLQHSYLIKLKEGLASVEASC